MSLKQKLAISLCTFYLVSIIGVALSLHFCGGKLDSISALNAKEVCKYCKSEPNCCNNTKIDVKVKDNHKIESAVKLPKVFSIDAFIPRVAHTIFKQFLPNLFNKVENKNHPRITCVALHVMNCVFRN